MKKSTQKPLPQLQLEFEGGGAKKLKTGMWIYLRFLTTN